MWNSERESVARRNFTEKDAKLKPEVFIYSHSNTFFRIMKLINVEYVR